MIISDKHYLVGESVFYLDCPKNKQKFNPGFPDTIVLHYTAGSSAESSAKYLAQNDVKASAHIIVSREGNIIQLVPFHLISWHAGKSQHLGRTFLNKLSIGIEIDNAGMLNYEGMSEFGKKYPDGEIYVDDDGVKWHEYTGIQIQLVRKICLLLIEKYPIKYIVGHSDIAPGRKFDPGSAFPLMEFRRMV